MHRADRGDLRSRSAASAGGMLRAGVECRGSSANRQPTGDGMKNRDVETKRRRDEVRANFISLRLYVSSSLRLFFAALAILPFTSGCVLFQIRDELRHVNQQMTQINSSLQEVNQKLGTSGESEAGVNKSMQTIQVSLHRIDDELA